MNRELTYLFIKNLEDEYKNNRQKIVFTCALYHSLYKFYQPKSIIISGMQAFYNIIAIQVAKKNNVKTKFCVDGYTPAFYKPDWFKNFDNTDYLHDEYYAFGQGMSEIFTEYLSIDKKSINIIQPPIFDIYKSKKNYNKNIKKYDVMILAYTSNLLNPSVVWDNQLFIESDILYVLNKLNTKNIAIKFKNGPKQFTAQQKRNLIDYKKIIKKKYNLDIKKINVEFIHEKELNEVIYDTKLLIGQISTAIIESLHIQTPFIIYEPSISGTPKEIIETSKIYSKENVAKDIIELEDMILNKRSSLEISKDLL